MYAVTSEFGFGASRTFRNHSVVSYTHSNVIVVFTSGCDFANIDL